MTHIFASSSRLALALGLALATAGGVAAFVAKAHADSSTAAASVHCFVGLKGDPVQGPLSRGWVCLPEHRDPVVTH